MLFRSLLLGATGVFGELQSALNTIWNVKPKPQNGLILFALSRFWSLTMVLGIGFLLLVSLVLSAALSGIGAWVQGYVGELAFMAQLINIALSFIVTTVLFALIYKVLPDLKIAWRDVWVGAVITALLFSIGRILIGLYLGNSAIGSSYGAAGSLVGCWCGCITAHKFCSWAQSLRRCMHARLARGKVKVIY